MATQIGSQLVNVLYILDEQALVCIKETMKDSSIHSKNLRDIGNSVLVVEHDKDMILEADYVLDITPELVNTAWRNSLARKTKKI